MTYSSVKMVNGTVASISTENNGNPFKIATTDGKAYVSKKVVLATGVKDLLPSTPGLAAGWGKGIFCMIRTLIDSVPG